MIKSFVKNNVIRIFVLVFVLLLVFWIIKKSIVLREFRYGTYPTPITDEFTYVWQAVSLKRYGVPMAWTINNGVYQNSKFNPNIGEVNGFKIDDVNLEKFIKDSRPRFGIREIDYIKGKEHVFFVSPFFDHPPLGGLIYSMGVDKNIANVEDVKSDDFRRPALVMAVITAILLFIFLTLLTNNFGIGLLGLIIYSTVPTYLLATRTAFLENVVSPLALAHLISLFWYTKNYAKKYSILVLILSGIVGGLCFLAKEPGIFFVIGSIILLWKNKINFKNILIFLVGCSLPVLIYFGWGAWLHKDLFMAILLTNASRGYFGAIKIVTMLEALKFKNFPTDGWWIWGMLSFVLISIKAKNKNILFLTVPLFTHILGSLLIGSGNAPWYWLSTIPFLTGCSAILIGKIMFNPNLVPSLLFFLIPFSSSYYWGREALGIAPDISHYRKSFLIFILLLGTRLKFKNTFTKWMWIIFMGCLMYKVLIFNEVFFPYLIAHWGNLPVLNLPNY